MALMNDKARKSSIKSRNVVKDEKQNGKGDSCIVTFRAPTKDVDKLTRKLKDRPIIGIRSVHQYSRKLFMDFVAGKVVYLNATDAAEDPSLAS